jgi:DNA-binding FadR family transcriptional regulator
MKQQTEHSHLSLAEKVAEQIENLIRIGKLSEGDRLPAEPLLMKKYGVGRSSVREAVKMLANAGLLSVEQGRGTFVRKPKAHPATAPVDEKAPWPDAAEAAEARVLTTAALAMGASKGGKKDSDD